MLKFNRCNKKLKHIYCIPYWEFMQIKRFTHQRDIKVKNVYFLLHLCNISPMCFGMKITFRHLLVFSNSL